jgi:hypothetical protein
MTPAPRMSAAAPYRWVPSVNLDPQDVEALLRALPIDSDIGDRLRATAQDAVQLAGRLNQIERGEKAA